jgi:hypothetical protein
MVPLLVISSIVPVAVGGVGLHRWSQTHEAHDGARTPVTTADHPAVAAPTMDAVAAEDGPSIPSCPDEALLAGRWRMTTTTVGASRRIRGGSGRYRLEFTRPSCESWAVLEKTGYDAKELTPEQAQHGRARLVPAGPWGDHAVEEARVTLERQDGGGAIDRAFRFIPIDGDTLVGEWREAGRDWDRNGLWGYFFARPDLSTYLEQSDAGDLPCALACRMGCEAPRREADGLPPHADLSPCIDRCSAGHRSELCERKDDFSLGVEMIGELGLGASIEEIRATLGSPTSVSAPAIEYATGLRLQTWSYPGAGLELRIALDDDRFGVRPRAWRGRPTVSGSLASITVSAPSLLRTSQGVGIGTEADAVRHAYGPFLDRELEDPGRIIVGSMYGGLFLTIEGERVHSMFLGAGAE